MAPKSRERGKDSLTKEERAKMIAAGKLRDKRILEQKVKDEKKRNCVGKSLPGDSFFQVRHNNLSFLHHGVSLPIVSLILST
jgi:hypothetical protein